MFSGGFYAVRDNPDGSILALDLDCVIDQSEPHGVHEIQGTEDWVHQSRAALGRLSEAFADAAATAVRIRDMECRIVRLEQQSSRLTVLTALATNTLKLLRPIPVAIEHTGDDFLATFFDANISASGDTAQEAFANFADVLELKFKLLNSLEENKLGPDPKRQLAILQQFIRKV